MKGLTLAVLFAMPAVLFLTGRELARGRTPGTDNPAPGTGTVKGLAKFVGQRPATTHISMNAE